MQSAGRDHQLLGHAAGDGRADDAVAGLQLRHAGADRLDHAGHLAARRERPRGLELIAVLDDEHVGIVDAAGLDGEQHLSRLPASDRAAPRAQASRGRRRAGSTSLSWPQVSRKPRLTRTPQLTETAAAVDGLGRRALQRSRSGPNRVRGGCRAPMSLQRTWTARGAGLVARDMHARRRHVCDAGLECRCCARPDRLHRARPPAGHTRSMPSSTGKSAVAEAKAECMRLWDAGTHMSKQRMVGHLRPHSDPPRQPQGREPGCHGHGRAQEDRAPGSKAASICQAGRIELG